MKHVQNVPALHAALKELADEHITLDGPLTLEGPTRWYPCVSCKSVTAVPFRTGSGATVITTTCDECRHGETPSLDAEAWNLYHCMPGAEDAARELSVALSQAAKEPTVRRACGLMRRALTKFDDFGALDTEPRAVARHELWKLLKDDTDYHSSEVHRWL